MLPLLWHLLFTARVGQKQKQETLTPVFELYSRIGDIRDYGISRLTKTNSWKQCCKVTIADSFTQFEKKKSCTLISPAFSSLCLVQTSQCSYFWLCIWCDCKVSSWSRLRLKSSWFRQPEQRRNLTLAMSKTFFCFVLFFFLFWESLTSLQRQGYFTTTLSWLCFAGEGLGKFSC